MKNFKINKLDLTVALYIFGLVTAELMGIKTFRLTNFSWAHLSVTVSIFVMPLLFTMIDSVVEVYGRARARSMVYSGLVVVVLIILYTALATHLQPSQEFASSEPAYDSIFNSSIRLSAASLGAFAISEIMDVAIFSRLRLALKGRALWLRNNLTNFASQLADSVVFMTLAFYSVGESVHGNAAFLFDITLPYWLIRCGLSIFETPLVYLGVWWLRGSMDPRVKAKP